MYDSANLQFGTQNCVDCALAYANLQRAFAQNENPVIRVFLNGFTLEAKSGALQISVSPINLQNTTLTFKITLGKTTMINSVALSWVAFSPASANFASYGGQISQNQYSGSVSSDISSSIYKSEYTIYGLTLLSITSGKGINFASSVDTDFIITISSSIAIDSFSLVYVAIGQLPGQQCQNCGEEKTVYGNACVSSCPDNTYAFTYKDGGVACRVCSGKLGLVLANGKCVAGNGSAPSAPATPSVVPITLSAPSAPSTHTEVPSTLSVLSAEPFTHSEDHSAP